MSWDTPTPPTHTHLTHSHPRGLVGCCVTPLHCHSCFPRNIIRRWVAGVCGGVLREHRGVCSCGGGAFVQLTSKRHAAAPTPGHCDANTHNKRPLTHSHRFLVPLRVLDVGGLTATEFGFPLYLSAVSRILMAYSKIYEDGKMISSMICPQLSVCTQVRSHGDHKYHTDTLPP